MCGLPHRLSRTDPIWPPLSRSAAIRFRAATGRAADRRDVHGGLHPYAAPQDAPPAPGLHTNNNLVSQQVSGFIAGKLDGNLGSFIQLTGDPVAATVGVDASDVRYADTLQLFGKDTIWGIDVNNAPTVEDPWNTTPSGGGRKSHRPSRPRSVNR